jgi:hypothetical protein
MDIKKSFFEFYFYSIYDVSQGLDYILDGLIYLDSN